MLKVVRRHHRPTIGSALLLAGLSTSCHAAPNQKCISAPPPLAAAVNASEGSFIFIFPRQLKDDFTGCQTLWNARGEVVFVLTFHRGFATSYQEFSNSGHLRLSCAYRGKKLRTTSAECPSYDEIASGFKTLHKEEEPQVPANVDPRRN